MDDVITGESCSQRMDFIYRWELYRYTKEKPIINNVGMERQDLNKRCKMLVLDERKRDTFTKSGQEDMVSEDVGGWVCLALAS